MPWICTGMASQEQCFIQTYSSIPDTGVKDAVPFLNPKRAREIAHALNLLLGKLSHGREIYDLKQN